MGLLYYISIFKIVPAAASAKPIDTNVTIVIGKHTLVQDLIQSITIPRHNLAVCSMQTILSRVYNNEILSGMFRTIRVKNAPSKVCPKYIIVNYSCHQWTNSLLNDSDAAGVITEVSNINYGTNDIERVDITLITDRFIHILFKFIK